MQKPNKQSEPKKDPVAPYQPTPEECRGLEKLRARDAERMPSPHVKAGAGGQTSIAIDHPDKATGVALLRLATGSEDIEFLAGLLTNFGNIGGARNGDGGHGCNCDQPNHFKAPVRCCDAPFLPKRNGVLASLSLNER